MILSIIQITKYIMEAESDEFGINRTRRGAFRRKSSENPPTDKRLPSTGNDLQTIVEEEIIIPIIVNTEEIRHVRMKSVKQPNMLVNNTNLTIPGEPLDRRTASIKRAQQGMRPEERKALIKDDFAYVFFKMAGEDELLDAFELQYFMHLICPHLAAKWNALSLYPFVSNKLHLM